MKVIRTPTTAYDIKEWMWGIEKDTPKVGVRKDDVINCRHEQRTLTLSILVEVVDSAEGKEDHAFLEILLVVHPPLGVGVPIREAIEVHGNQP